MDGFQRGRAEASAVGNHFSLQGFSDIGLHVEKGVERPVRNRAADAWECVEPAAHQVAPRLEFLPHLFDAGLLALQGGKGRILTDARWVARLLALHVCHGLDDRQGSDGPAHAPAGHRIALADAADGDDLLRQLRPQRGETGCLGVSEDELFIDLIADDSELRVEDDVGERLEFSPAIDAAGRIARRVDHHEPGARGDGGLEMRRRHFEAACFGCVDQDE
jgi:hypothetical protein